MEIINLDKDVKTFYVQAESFPEGIQAAHEKLHSIIGGREGRSFYGISHPENGVIRYMAATTEIFEGEAEQYPCKTFLIKSGKYASETIKDYRHNIGSIEPAFKKLLQAPNIAANGYCLEVYGENDMQCMVLLRDEK